MITISKVKESHFVKSVFLVVTGALGAQLVSLISSPIITRLFNPDTLGALTSFTSLVLAIGPILALTLPTAAVLPKNPGRASEILRISFFIMIINTLLLYSVVNLIFDNVNSLSDISEYSSYVVFSCFFYSLLQGYIQYKTRSEEFKHLAKVTFSQSILNNSGKIIVGVISASSHLLIFTTSIVYFIISALSFKTYANVLSRRWNIKYSALVLLKYKDFIFYRTPEVLVNGLSQLLPIIFLTHFFSLWDVGQYGLARSILGIPVVIIGKAVGDVFYSKGAKYKENNKVSVLLRNSIIALSFIGLIPFSMIFVFGEELFVLIFGEQWGTAGIFGAWISIWMFSGLIIKPIVSMVAIIQEQRFYFFYSLLSLSVKVIMVYWIAYYYQDVNMFISAYCLICSISNFILAFIIYGKAKHRWNK